jgi:electron transport complex protein RnfG
MLELPSVSDATELEEVTGYTTANVTGVVKAPDGSLAIKAEESGFDGGIVTVIVGMDANGTETGIWVDASTQTKGIGSAVAEDDFLKQFDGLDCTQNVVMGENGVDGKTGATFSSKALFAAINDCVNCYNELA